MRGRGGEWTDERAIAVESFEKVRSSGRPPPSLSLPLVSTLHGHRDAENETSGKRRSKTDGRGCERAMDRSGQLHRE